MRPWRRRIRCAPGGLLFRAGRIGHRSSPSISHSLGRRSSRDGWSSSIGASTGTTPRCGILCAMRAHSSIRRAPSMSSDSVEIRAVASVDESAAPPSTKEKKPSCHDMSSKTTASICEPDLALELAPRQAARFDEQFAEPFRIRSTLLRSARALQVAFGDLPGAHQHRAQRNAGSCRMNAEHDTPAVEADDAFVVTQRRRDAQRPGLPAQIEQLEDVVNAELAERAFDRHYAAGPRATKNALQIDGRARIPTRAPRVLTRRLEVHHAPPPFDRLPVPMLIGGEHPFEVERANVLRVEAQDARERDGTRRRASRCRTAFRPAT